jgi:hypothetical protein
VGPEIDAIVQQPERFLETLDAGDAMDNSKNIPSTPAT